MRQNVFRLICFSLAVFIWPLWAVSSQTTYQARIIKPDGEPLESSSVNFKFTILDPSATCVLYSETFSNLNMSSTSGLVSFSLGSGIKTYPASSTTFENVFSNITPSLSCDTGGPGSYTPVVTDIRKIVMQFNDGSGWQTLPAMNINAVPYAMYANEALKLSGYAASDFVHVATVPTCGVSEALRYSGLSFSCVAVGSGSGSVTSGSVVSALGYTPADSNSVLSVSSTVFSVSASVNTLATSIASLSATVSAVTSSQWISSGTAIFYNLGNVGIGGSAPNSTLDIQGSLSKKITTIATDATLGSSDHIVFVNGASGNITVTLPSAVGLLGREYYIQKIDTSSNLVNIVPQAGQLVGTTDNKNLNRNGEYFVVMSDGTKWNILNEKGLSYTLSASASTVVDVTDASSTVYTWLPGTGSATTATFADLGFGPLITFGGNANTNEAGYYQVNQVISGDKEIRISVYFNDTNSQCNDPFVIITPPGSAPVFDWNPVSGQMEFGFDCESPGIYGTSIDSFDYGYTYSGGWKTFQIIYLPSLNKSYFRVYDGRNSIVGLPLSEITMNEAPWSSWQINLTADQDSPVNGPTQFADLIVSDCGDPETCGNPNYVPPAEIYEQIGFMPLNSAGGTMTGVLNLPAGGLNVGAGEFIVATNGNVGIGTTNPNYDFDVNGTINANSILINGSPLQQVWNKNGTFAYYNSGNVGIGTSSPSARLDVAGTVKISGGSPGVGKVLTSDASGNATWQSVSGDNLGNHTATQNINLGNNKLVGQGGSEGITIDSLGNIRLGSVGGSTGVTLGPGTATTGSSWGSIAAGFSSTASSITSFAFGSNANASNWYAFATGNNTTAAGRASAVFGQNMTVNGNYSVGFGLSSSVSYTAATPSTMVIMGGNVGVGTTTPQATLDVSGPVRMGASVATCNATIEGSQRYNSTSKVMEYCNGTSWLKIGSQNSRKYARLVTSGSLTSGAGAITTVSWASASEDNGTFYSAGSPTRITIPSGVTRVKLCASIAVSSGSAITMNYFQIMKNNADFSGAFHISGDASDNNWGGYACTPAITVTTGDYFEVTYYSRDVAITFSQNRTWFTIEEQ